MKSTWIRLLGFALLFSSIPGSAAASDGEVDVFVADDFTRQGSGIHYILKTRDESALGLRFRESPGFDAAFEVLGSEDRPYYVSYAGDEAASTPPQAGVTIHRLTGESSGDPEYVDTLSPGEEFHDPESGLTLSLLGASSDEGSTSLEVGFDCVPATPQLTVSPAVQAGASGATLPYGVFVQNLDSAPCAESVFDLSGSFPAGLAGSFADASLALAPGATGTTTLSLAVAGEEGTHDFEVLAVGPAASGSGGASVLVDNTPPSTPSLSGSVKRKTQVNLTWTEASDTGSGVARYGVHREDAEGVATEWLTLQTRFSDSWTVSGATYTYTVYALDAAGLRSADSNELVISLGGKKGGGGKGKKK
jgi:hypothetical protein